MMGLCMITGILRGGRRSLSFIGPQLWLNKSCALACMGSIMPFPWKHHYHFKRVERSEVSTGVQLKFTFQWSRLSHLLCHDCFGLLSHTFWDSALLFSSSLSRSHLVTPKSAYSDTLVLNFVGLSQHGSASPPPPHVHKLSTGSWGGIRSLWIA